MFTFHKGEYSLGEVNHLAQGHTGKGAYIQSLNKYSFYCGKTNTAGHKPNLQDYCARFTYGEKHQ